MAAKPYTQAQYNRALAYLNTEEAQLLPDAPWWAQQAIQEHLTPQVMANFADGVLTAALTEPSSTPLALAPSLKRGKRK